MINLESFLAAHEDSVRRVVWVNNEEAIQVAFIVYNDPRLIGTVTDSGVSRGLLHGVTLDDSVSANVRVNFGYISELANC
jgi:hypothetical protein